MENFYKQKKKLVIILNKLLKKIQIKINLMTNLKNGGIKV